MKKNKLILEGLNCAHCASVIENKIIDSKAYENVSFNFATKVLILNSDKDMQTLIKEVQATVDSIESGVTVKEYVAKTSVESHNHEHCHCNDHDHKHEHSHSHEYHKEDEHNHSHEHSHESSKGTSSLIIAGVLFVVSIVIGALTENFYIDCFATMLQITAVIVAGYDTFFNGIKSLIKLRIDENFLLLVAVVAAFCIGEGVEAVVVTLLFVLGEKIEDFAVGKSRKSIEKLASIRPDTATLISDGKETLVPAEEVEQGSTIRVAPHKRIPIDSVVLRGNGYADRSAITGESIPVEIKEGLELLSGSINGDSVIELRTTKPYTESAASRIISIVEDAAAVKGNSEKFITRFARVYTPIVIAFAVLLTVLGTLLGLDTFSNMLYRSLVILVASCPCAIVISVPLGFYSGIGAASKKGILIKGSKYIEVLANADCIAFDKTGTLTNGDLKLEKTDTFNGFDKAEALSLASACEKYSSHPLAIALRKECDSIDLPELINYNEIAGKGVKAEYSGKAVLCGNRELMLEHNIECGGTYACYLAYDGKLVAAFTFADSIKSDAKQTVSNLRNCGFKKIAMLTGDKKQYADSIASQCDISDVYSELLPEQKVSTMQKLSQDCKNSLYVGDGINDAPLLASAGCGIAMGLGSEAAIEAADAVLADGTIKRLPDCIKLARKTMNIIRFNILFTIIFKLIVLVLAAVGFAPIWLAVIADTGLSVLCILNSSRINTIK